MTQTATATPGIAPAIERASLADSAYESLLEAILTGRLPGGTVLNTVALAQQLDVSRTPVQEALRRLANDGLVRQENWRRAHVITLSREDVRDIYEQRALLEGAAAQRAATRIGEEALETLRAETAALAAAISEVDWPLRVIDFDIRFHDLVALASGNRQLLTDIRRYRLLVRGLCRVTGTHENLHAAFEEHLLILDALQSRAADAARDAMVRHIESRLATVLKTVYAS